MCVSYTDSLKLSIDIELNPFDHVVWLAASPWPPLHVGRMDVDDVDEKLATDRVRHQCLEDWDTHAHTQGKRACLSSLVVGILVSRIFQVEIFQVPMRQASKRAFCPWRDGS